ncbi:MAG: response regulator [Chitinophagaceae bacterium]|nr:MAG: response regulator [Chitinophagaceae bacterium]
MNQPVHILLVEDNEGDIVLAREALQEGNLLHNLSVARDGEDALRFLRREPPHEGAATPDLVLLDINLPRIDGKEVLATIKQDPGLKVIPVVMLTTSSSEKDVHESYANHANCYITKPVDLDKFMLIVQKIEAFWLSIVKLPSYRN